jgi:hypothetical protein
MSQQTPNSDAEPDAQPDPDGEMQLPESLDDAMGQMLDFQVQVPDALDQRIFSAAKEHLAPIGQSQSSTHGVLPDRDLSTGPSVLRRIGPWIAVAAACLVLIIWLGRIDPKTGRVRPMVKGQPDSTGRFVVVNDVDGSGRIDVLDAFSAARDFQVHYASNKQRDLNGDGWFDQGEVGFAFPVAVPLPDVPKDPDADTPVGDIRFTQLKIYIDSTEAALAGYQLDLSIQAGDVKFVGIGNGQHTAFSTPAYYDPKAMQTEQLNLSAFTTAAVKDLPIGKTLVAQIQIIVRGDVKPKYQIKLRHAVDAKGMPIRATVSLEEGS